jgi:hypothetical protein
LSDDSSHHSGGPGWPNDQLVRFVLAMTAIGIVVACLSLGTVGVLLGKEAVTAFATRSLDASWRVLLVVYAGYYGAQVLARRR